ncbi:RHS repeat-associated core domain-containing protein [bacterium]|nr:MAG: RHS repeat-associated core domain-containing protein [bacterium]
MPKKAKSKRRRSAFSAKPKLPLKQRILRRVFRALPFAMNAFLVFTILIVLAAIGTIGWQAFAQSGGGGEDPPPTRTVEYKYDDHGMLVGRLVKDGGGTVIEDRRFLVDYHSITGYPQFLAEINYKTQTPFKENVWGPDGLLSQTEWINGNEYIVRYPMADAQGTIRAVQHEYHGGPKNGTTEVTYHDYSPFGELLGDPPAVGYAFQGQWRDPDTGMQFHWTRWYDPRTGRWNTKDGNFDFPKNFGNEYAFVGQNPVNNTDPTGNMTLSETVQTLAIRGYAMYDQYSNLNDIISIARTVASGQSVAALDVALVMFSMLPNTPNFKHVPWQHGKHIVDPQDVDNIAEAIRRYAPQTIKDKQTVGEFILRSRAKNRGLKPVHQFSPSGQGYDDIFRHGDDLVIGEAKLAEGSVSYTRRETTRWMEKRPELLAKYGPPPYKQGSEAWVADYAIELMESQGRRRNPALGQEILDKLKEGKVLWYEVVTKTKGEVPSSIVETVRKLD